MKIQPVNINNNYSFQARKKEIKKADDIVRKVNNEFPAFSTTFATRNWNILERKDCYFVCCDIYHSCFCPLHRSGSSLRKCTER